MPPATPWKSASGTLPTRTLSLFVLTLSLGMAACSGGRSSSASPDPRADELEEAFGEYDARGTFVLVREGSADTLLYHADDANRRSLPASTFKILNSLIALETGVLADERQVIPWDSVDRGWSEWNRDHDMESAFRVSAVWFYQEVARSIGEERMERWLEEVEYGNADVSGGVDRFWLDGGLRISPLEQVRFLARLRRGDLPFRPEHMETVRRIMVDEEGEGWVLQGKTGWARPGGEGGPQVGWKVGWVEWEEGGDPTYFAVRLETEDPDFPMRRAQRDITRALLEAAGALPPRMADGG